MKLFCPSYHLCFFHCFGFVLFLSFYSGANKKKESKAGGILMHGKHLVIFFFVLDCTFSLSLLSWILLHSGRYFLRFACRQYCPRYFGIPLCFSLRKIRSAQIKKEKKYQKEKEISAVV